MEGVDVVSRKALSAPVATIIGILALLIGMVAFTSLSVAVIKSVGTGSEIAGHRAMEERAVVKVYAQLVQEISGDTLLNKTFITFENEWPGEVTVDHIAVVSKSGGKILSKTFSLKLKAGESVSMKPSQIDPSLAEYDEEVCSGDTCSGGFWKFKRDVGYVEMHVDVGGSGFSFKSYPLYSISGESGEIVQETVTIPGTTLTSTSTETVTTTITSTTTPTTTVTTTATITSTYTTMPTYTTTTTCTKTTCSQIGIPTTYKLVTVIAPSTVVVYKTSFTKIINCYTWVASKTIIATATVPVGKGTWAGTKTCDVCGTCPTTLYGGNSYNQSSNIPFTTLFIALVGIISGVGRPRRREIILLSILLLSLLAWIYMGVELVEGYTVTVTQTGSPTTTTVTVTTTQTVTSTSTAPTTTITSTVTTTVTTTVTSPTTTTITSTSLKTEYRCLGVTVTETGTYKPVIVSTSTIYKSTSCYYAYPIYVTETYVNIVTNTWTYFFDTYWLVCRTTSNY